MQTYAHNYLREEIQVEQLVRNLDPFRKFLQVAAQMSGKIINYSKIATEVGASDRSVQTYFQILEETLIGSLLEPYHTSIRKRQRQAPKFYFFDTGVMRALDRTITVPLVSSTYAFGVAFEHFIVNELRKLSSYRRNDFAFSYLRTKDDAEIDLIVERPGAPTALVEIKSTQRITDNDVRTLQTLAADFKNANAYCLSLDPHRKRIGTVECLPWRDGLNTILG